MKSQRSFTLVEMIIVVVIVSLISTLAYTSVMGVLRSAEEQRAALNLREIYRGNEVRRTRTGVFWNTGPTTVTDINVINTTLRTAVIAGNIDYSYRRDESTGDNTYAAEAVLANGATLRIRPGRISAANPCCTTTTPACPNIAACGSISCGNSIVEPGEECDDGDITAGDGCDSGCQIE